MINGNCRLVFKEISIKSKFSCWNSILNVLENLMLLSLSMRFAIKVVLFVLHRKRTQVEFVKVASYSTKNSFLSDVPDE